MRHQERYEEWLQNAQPSIDVVAPTLASERKKKKAKEGRTKLMSERSELGQFLFLSK